MIHTSSQIDLRSVATYPIGEAAHYLMIPTNTLRSWVLGCTTSTEIGPRFVKPLLELPQTGKCQLSFTNLVEAHLLRVIRLDHRIPLYKVRTALDYVDQNFDVPHPLARIEFQTDGADLFVESVGKLISVSQAGQLAIRETLKHFLERIELDEKGLASRLFPFTRVEETDDPKVVVIDPRIAFGRPVLVGTGIPTAVVAERYKAGDSIDDLADDYSCERLLIEEAIRCEFPRAV